MKKSLRFTGEARFIQHRRSAKRNDTANFTAFVSPSPDGNWYFAAVASKRIGGAVERNRAKRRLRSAFAEVRKTISLTNGDNQDMSLSVILYAKQGILTADYQKIVASLKNALVLR